MRLLLELSMEHPTLPRAEALALLEGLEVPHREVASEPGVLEVEVEGRGDPGELAGVLASRLGLTHAVLASWLRVEPSVDAAVAALELLDLDDVTPQAGSFAVRPRRLGNAHREVSTTELARRAGAVLARAWPVDLENPQREVRFLLADDALVGGVVLARVDRSAFEERHVRHRPFFSPVSLHPRLARALVNLARVGPGDRVLDPFAGTGGVALEAGLLGCEVLASDLDPRMVAGTRETLASYGVEARFRQADVADAAAWAGPVDAVVTDPPYGRASTTDREELRSLYRRFLEAARDALRPGGHVATIFPAAAHAAEVPPGLTRLEHHVQRVHGSLDRHWVVLRKDA